MVQGGTIASTESSWVASGLQNCSLYQLARSLTVKALACNQDFVVNILVCRMCCFVCDDLRTMCREFHHCKGCHKNNVCIEICKMLPARVPSLLWCYISFLVTIVVYIALQSMRRVHGTYFPTRPLLTWFLFWILLATSFLQSIQWQAETVLIQFSGVTRIAFRTLEVERVSPAQFPYQVPVLFYWAETCECYVWRPESWVLGLKQDVCQDLNCKEMQLGSSVCLAFGGTLSIYMPGWQVRVLAELLVSFHLCFFKPILDA
jgi:hypothetical protein